MALTSLGKWAFLLTLGVYAFREGGTTAVGLVALAQAIPATFAAPLLGLAGDRYPRQRVLLATNLARAVLLGGIALAALHGRSVVLVFALAALFATISTANQPARAALIPVLARTPAEVSSATVLMGAVDNGSFLIGAGGGGVLLAATSVQFVVALCCLAYLLATALILAIPVDARPPKQRWEAPLGALAAGLRTTLEDDQLRLVALMVAALSVVDGLSGVFVIVTSVRLLHTGTAGIGYLNIARGVGGIVGGSLAYSLHGRSRLPWALALGSLILGAPLVALSLLPHVALGLVAWAALGLGYLLVKVSCLTLVQRLSGDRVLARVLAVLETTFVATIGLGAILAPALISLLSLRGALALTGVALPAIAALRWRQLRRVDFGAPVPEPQFALVRRCSVFAPLPLARAEVIARRLHPLEVREGEDVIVQGERGNRFYLIADGAVEVLQDGVTLRTQGPGESFGEIALLHDVTRTATVRATAPTSLFALERDPFLVSVTGHADSHETALGVAERRLRSEPEPLTRSA